MAVNTYTKSGSKATTAAKLPKDVFAAEIKSDELVRSAYEAYLANSRTNNAVAKTRGLVRGGGRKPWKQKGTGRARFGSIRTPIWRGGGITFGPTGNESYKIGINKKARKTAIRQALTMKSDNIAIIESFAVDGKTKEAAKLLDKIGANRNVLLVTEDANPQLVRATNNLDYVKVVTAKYINVYDALNADHIVITKAALPIIEEWLATPTKGAK